MYYPTSLRIWRQQEELGDLLDMYISRIQQGQLFSAKTRISKPVGQAATGGVETWKRSSAFAAPEKPSATSGAGTKAETTDAAPVLLGSGGSARYEMLLERLPYLTRIMQKKSLPIPLSPATLRDLRKLTTFTGTTNFTEDPEDDADDDPLETEQWATDRPVTDTPRKKTRNVNFIVRKGADGEGLDMVVEKEVRGLVLSDDDIED
jgi:cell cycle checkpoint protein